MGKPVVAYTDITEVDPAPGVDLLEAAGFQVELIGSADPDVIAAGATGAVALLVGYSTIDGRLLDALPSVRLVATQSAGVDMVDLPACAARGVTVSNVPDAATEEVAMHALAMSLALLRGLPFLDRDVRSGLWDGTRHPLRRPSEVTIGVIGLGRIGRRYADAVGPLVERVVACAPGSPKAELELIDLDALLGASDLVSLHLPLTEQTRHLLDDRALSLMPDGAMLVNVSRGGLVDPHALRSHLDSRHLAAAALDVLETEPPLADDPLVGHPRVLLSPHAAYLSPVSARQCVLDQARNVVAFVRDGRPLTPVTA
jgi:phosphoglycerate dehydrogenase-like enzyme